MYALVLMLSLSFFFLFGSPVGCRLRRVRRSFLKLPLLFFSLDEPRVRQQPQATSIMREGCKLQETLAGYRE